MDIDQEKAKSLYENGAIFVFLDVPVNIVFGIDYNCWRTGDKFRGVKMIPPGIHFIYFNSVEKSSSAGGDEAAAAAAATIGERSGFFHNFKRGEILVKKWSRLNETLDLTYVCSDSELERMRLNKQDMDRFLGAYPYENYKRWHSLTNQISDEAFLARLLPENKLITSSSNLIGQSFKSSRSDRPPATASETDGEKIMKMPSSLQEAEKMLPKMTEEVGTNLRFSKIANEQRFPKQSQPNEITKHSIDLTYRLNSLMTTNEHFQMNANNLLCELQLAFVLFLIGNVYEAFEQWKFLTHLLCNSETFILSNVNVYLKLLSVLYFQLKEMPDDFFTDLTTQNNFLGLNLHNLFSSIQSLAANNENDDSISNLNKRASDFKSYLIERFHFDFDEEPDEYAPIIVDLETPVTTETESEIIQQLQPKQQQEE